MYGFTQFIIINKSIRTFGYKVRHERLQRTLEQIYLSPAIKFANLTSRFVTILLWTSLLSIAAVALVRTLLGLLPFHYRILVGNILVIALLETFGMDFFPGRTKTTKQGCRSDPSRLAVIRLPVPRCDLFSLLNTPTTMESVCRQIPFSCAIEAFRSTLMDYPEDLPDLATLEFATVIITAHFILMPLVSYYHYREDSDVFAVQVVCRIIDPKNQSGEIQDENWVMPSQSYASGGLVSCNGP